MIFMFKKASIVLLSLIIVLISAELLLRAFNDFGLVYPYEEFFTNKSSQKSIHRGNLWDDFEFENIVIRNQNMQHLRDFPDFSKEQKIVYILGDSMVEAVAEPLGRIFYNISDDRHDEYCVVAQHFAGCSLKALTILLYNYPNYLKQNNKVYKPSLAVFQLRRYSYRGGNTVFFDPNAGPVDYQEKLSTEEKLPAVVELKKSFLDKLKLDVKFSQKPQDKIFRALVLGESHILSLLAWKFYNWSLTTGIYPNQERFITSKYNLEDAYWARFERELQVLLNVSDTLQIPVAVLLIPDPENLKHYHYAGSFNETEKKYIELFQKYQIPYEYAIEEFDDVSRFSQESLFWNDGHPSHKGQEAIALSLDKLIGRFF